MIARPDFQCLFEAASEQHGYFTRRQADGCGYGTDLLFRHKEGGRFIHVHRGVYRLRDYPSFPREEVVAAWLAVGKDVAVVSHESALDLHELSDVIPNATHLTVPRSMRNLPKLPGVKIHTTTRAFEPGDVVTRDGMRVTSVERTITDAAERGTGPEQIEMAVHQALGQGMTSPKRLEAAISNRNRRVRNLVKGAMASRDREGFGNEKDTLSGKISTLRKLVDELLGLSDHTLQRRIPFDGDDHFQIMLLSYFSKQVDHLDSIRTLVNHGKDGDATVLARMMAEGLAQLLWATNTRPDGPDLWYWFGAVMDWRQLKENEKDGEQVNPDDWAALKKVLSERGRDYYNKEARSSHSNNANLQDDPYREQWNSRNTRQIFEAVQGLELYEMIYRPSSERIHWNPRSILRSLETVSVTQRDYQIADPKSALNALVSGFVSLLQTLEIVNSVFAPGIAEDLAAISDRFDEASKRDA